MKKILFVLSLALIVLAFVSCSSDNSPEGVVKEFISYLQDEKYEKAIDLFYSEKGLTEKDRQGYTEIFKKWSTQFKEMGGLEGIDITNVDMSEDGESAKVEFLYKYGDGSSKKGSSKVVKVDGKWMIDATK